jgi:hypothetical protein
LAGVEFPDFADLAIFPTVFDCGTRKAVDEQGSRVLLNVTPLVQRRYTSRNHLTNVDRKPQRY